MRYYVTDFGAKSDGSICTEQIQKAVDECYLAGGGEVIIPAGKFLTGCIRLRSNITLHLMEDAVLMGSINPEDYLTYLNDKIEPITEEERLKTVDSVMPQSQGSRSAQPHSRWNNAILRAINAQNIAIIGEKNSAIDGQNCYDENGEENYRGPHGINMWFCKNIKLSGYTIKDCGNWAHAIHNSSDIRVEDIMVLGGHDGFDARTCDNIAIESCEFYTGDDAIAGFDNINVNIRNCKLNSSCSAMRFGGTNVLVENCTTVSPNKYGFRGNLSLEQKKVREKTNETCRHNCINGFLYYCDYRARVRETPGNILIRNCKFVNVDAAFSHPFGHRWVCNRALDNILFEDCTFEGVCSPIKINCPDNEPLTFKMKNCTISARKGSGDIAVAEAINFRDMIFENVKLSGYGNAKIICYSAGNISFVNSTPMIVEKVEKIVDEQ